MFAKMKVDRQIEMEKNIEENNLEAVKELFKTPENHCNLDAALRHSVLHKKAAMAKFFVAQGANLEHTSDRGETVLFSALNDPKMISLLLESGAIIDAENSEGRTPLECAVLKEDVEVVALLLEYYPRPSRISGRSPVMNGMLADYSKSLETEPSYQPTTKQIIDFCHMCEFGCAEKVHEEIRKGIDINYGHMTPLCFALGREHPFIARKLLRHGAIINSPDKISPLIFAYKNLGMTRLLLALGADVNQHNGGNNYTPLNESASEGNYEKMEMILRHNPDLEIPDIFGWTPLHNAAFKGNVGQIRLLISHGANIEARTHRGETPLMIACKESWVHAVSELLKLGADKQAVDNCGRNCRGETLAYADRYLKKEIIALLD